MKAKYIFIIILLSVMIGNNCLLSQDNHPVTTDLPIDSKRSKNLIDRFNTLRALEGLQSIEHDTVLDNICKILLTDETKIYRKSAGVYDEDSIRLLFREKGILDYRYEIKEISDKDTATVFKGFLLADRYNRMGYYRAGNKHILLKTESYLKCTHVLVSSHCDPIYEPLGSKLNSKQGSKCYTDSLVYYFRILIPNQYYYQFYETIPSNSEKGGNIKKEEVQMDRGTSEYGEYDFSIKSIGSKTNMFLVILNKNNQRVAVIK